MAQHPLLLRCWKREEYDRLVELGMLQHEPIELIGGRLVLGEPQGSYHATVVGAADDASCGRRSVALMALRAAAPSRREASL